jgi:hypothetical protein
MTEMVVAVFGEYGHAQSAMNALFNAGFTHDAVKLSPPYEHEARPSDFLRSPPLTSGDRAPWRMDDVFRSLFGTDQDQHGDDAGLYADAVRRGSYLLAVEAASAETAHHAADILQRCSAIHLRQRPAGRLT